MLVGVASAFQPPSPLASSIGQKLPMILSTVWITIMNTAYRSVAVYFNDMENYRTETEYNDALIIKTIIFQFVNSYITLFYIAFIKSSEVPMGWIFGMRNSIGDYYRDMCGARPMWDATDPHANEAAQINPPCVPGVLTDGLCCDINTGEGCDYLFVQRDCFMDLRPDDLATLKLSPSARSRCSCCRPQGQAAWTVSRTR